MRLWFFGRKQIGAAGRDSARRTDRDPGDGFVDTVVGAQRRERDRLLAEVVSVKTLMPLLMKQRNGERWTRQDRAALREQLRALGHLSPYLLIMVLPGSFALVPILAWWLDRRRGRREADARALTNPN